MQAHARSHSIAPAPAIAYCARRRHFRSVAKSRRRNLLAPCSRADLALVDLQIVLSHASHGEPLLEALAHARCGRAPERFRARRWPRPWCRRRSPVTPSSITSATAPFLKASTGVPQAIASIMASPNGSGQSIGKRSARASPRNLILRRSSISPMNSMPGCFSRGSISAAEVGLVDAIDLGGNLQRQADGAGDRDGAVDALLRRDAAEKRQIAAARIERQGEVSRQAVIDGADKVGVGDRRALRVRRSRPAACRENRDRGGGDRAGPGGRAAS